MKNKRLAHGKLIENFQEKSQQAEVIRHDLKETLEVSIIFNIMNGHKTNPFSHSMFFLVDFAKIH